MVHTIQIFVYQIVTVVTQIYIYKIYDASLSPEVLGFLLTIITVSSWLSVSDFGIASSLRNKVATLLQLKRVSEAHSYISSVYVNYFKILIGLLVLLIMLTAIFLHLNPIELKDSSGAAGDLHVFYSIVLILLGTVVNMYFLLNSSVAFALMKPAYKTLVLMVFNVLFAALLIWFNSIIDASLLTVSLSFFLSAVITSYISTAWLYKNKTMLRPSSIKSDMRKFREMVSIGKGFFIIQIAALIMYSTDSILIANLFEFSDVTTYKVNSKIFYIFVMAQGALLSPLWSKYTVYYASKNSRKIFSLLKRSMSITLFLLLMILITYYFGESIIQLWFGHSRYFNKDLMIAVAILTALMNISSNFSTIYNGIGSTELLVKISLFAAVINIPASIVLVKFTGLGPEGIPYGTIMALSLFVVFLPLKLEKTVIKACQ